MLKNDDKVHVTELMDKAMAFICSGYKPLPLEFLSVLNDLRSFLVKSGKIVTAQLFSYLFKCKDFLKMSMKIIKD